MNYYGNGHRTVNGYNQNYIVIFENATDSFTGVSPNPLSLTRNAAGILSSLDWEEAITTPWTYAALNYFPSDITTNTAAHCDMTIILYNTSAAAWQRTYTFQLNNGESTQLSELIQAEITRINAGYTPSKQWIVKNCIFNYHD